MPPGNLRVWQNSLDFAWSRLVWKSPLLRKALSERCAQFRQGPGGDVSHPLQSPTKTGCSRYIRRTMGDGRVVYLRLNDPTSFQLLPSGEWPLDADVSEATSDEEVEIPIFVDVSQDDLAIKEGMESIFVRFTSLPFALWNRYIIHLGTCPSHVGIFTLSNIMVEDHDKSFEVFDPDAGRRIKVSFVRIPPSLLTSRLVTNRFASHAGRHTSAQ